MANIFVISDTHFGHENMLNFKDRHDKPMRVFDDVHHMDEHMIERWNSVVGIQDHVYHLGDVIVRGKDCGRLLKRLNGHKRLVLGNHDFPKMSEYTPYFEKIYGTRLLDSLLLSHIPVHPLSLGKAIANIHGHVHNNTAPDHFGKQYLNVSVEVIDYTPVAWEALKKLVHQKLEQ